VHHAEDGRVAANPERQRQDRGGSNDRRLLQHAESVSNVLHQH
jgi:hypothetical protein